MSITKNETTIFLTDEERSSAARYITALGGDASDLQTTSGHELPPEINAVLGEVLKAMQEGRPITISTLPEEVTTTTAATMLGVTRPTVMKYIREDKLNAHMVGSHHRLLSKDVLSFREQLKNEKRQAVFGLMDLENDLANS